MHICFIDQCITTYNQTVAAQALAQAQFENEILSAIVVSLFLLVMILVFTGDWRRG